MWLMPEKQENNAVQWLKYCWSKSIQTLIRLGLPAGFPQYNCNLFWWPQKATEQQIISNWTTIASRTIFLKQSLTNREVQQVNLQRSLFNHIVLSSYSLQQHKIVSHYIEDFIPGNIWWVQLESIPSYHKILFLLLSFSSSSTILIEFWNELIQINK